MSKQQVRDSDERMSKRQQQLKERRERGKARARRRNATGLFATVIGAVLLVGALVYPSLKPVDISIPTLGEHPMADGNSMGDPNAPVQVTEYANFTCSHCANFYAESEAAIIEEYIKTGKVHYTYQPYVSPQDVDGFRAAEAAFCAGDQGSFWDMHGSIFANFDFYVQNAGISRRSLDTLAQQLGLDMDAFSTCMDDNVHQETINNATAEGGAVGVTGTPTFFVNGTAVVGDDPQGLIREIELALASATE
jgi:protein-disulfide isomerase